MIQLIFDNYYIIMPELKPNPVGRPPAKKDRVVRELRSLIVTGNYPPLSRLPTQRRLSRQFRVSPVTVQQAFDQLARDGFIQARGPLGTYVAPRPPHTSQLALIFPDVPSTSPRIRFWTALSNCAIDVDRDPASELRIRVLYGIKADDGNEDYLALCRDLRAQRIAGLIFACHPSMYEGTPLLDTAGMPAATRVAITSVGIETCPDLSRVNLDGDSFLDRAFDLLASRGRSRVALLTVPGMSQAWLGGFRSRLEARGMTTRDYWMQSPALDHPETARQLTHLLMHADQARRPDALVIADDNFVEHATHGLLDAGVRVPDDMDVVAHCNFPWPTPSAVPVTRIGFDARQVLDACLEAIDAARHGRGPTEINIPARFEDER